MSNPEIGAVAFGAIKLAGYCLAAHVLSKRYQITNPSVLGIGLTRTLIGIAFGYPYYRWADSFEDPFFFVGLIPIRLVEWLILIVIFYDRRLSRWPRALGFASGGTVWSFALDMPAALGYIMVGGFWIC